MYVLDWLVIAKCGLTGIVTHESQAPCSGSTWRSVFEAAGTRMRYTPGCIVGIARDGTTRVRAERQVAGPIEYEGADSGVRAGENGPLAKTIEGVARHQAFWIPHREQLVLPVIGVIDDGAAGVHRWRRQLLSQDTVTNAHHQLQENADTCNQSKVLDRGVRSYQLKRFPYDSWRSACTPLPGSPRAQKGEYASVIPSPCRKSVWDLR